MRITFVPMTPILFYSTPVWTHAEHMLGHMFARREMLDDGAVGACCSLDCGMRFHDDDI
jgi:hypothetical protein